MVWAVWLRVVVLRVCCSGLGCLILGCWFDSGFAIYVVSLLILGVGFCGSYGLLLWSLICGFWCWSLVDCCLLRSGGVGI